MNRIGFTGTQKGMTIHQKKALYFILKNDDSGNLNYGEFHHGDCIGADAEAHDIASELLYITVLHPPTIETKRAFKLADEVRDIKPYLDRNKDIVNETNKLIATPKEFIEQLRSGTWSTVRYAKKLKRRVVAIMPDGSLKFF